MRKKTRFPTKLEWLRPYLELGLSFISDGKCVERVGLWTLGKSRGLNCHASLFQDKIGDNFRIWLHDMYYGGEDGLTPVPFSRIDILKNFAHEIAHLEDWNHTPKHEALCSKITIAFMSRLKSEGYISEELELKK